MLHMTVAELLSRMSSEEMSEWFAWMKIKNDEARRGNRR